MSDQTLLNDADFAAQVTPEKAIKPAARWRNWWDYKVQVNCTHCGTTFGPGPSPTCFAYPSKDIAQTHGWSVDAENTEGLWPYIGAFPEGDA